MLLVRPRYCLGGGPRDPDAEPAGPAGLVGLGPPGLVPGLRWDEEETAPGLMAGVLVGLLGDGDKCPHGPASAWRNLCKSGVGLATAMLELRRRDGVGDFGPSTDAWPCEPVREARCSRTSTSLLLL